MAERVIHDPPVPGADLPQAHYRFVGEAPEVFPDPPIHAELASGDEFDAPEGLVHPRVEVKEEDGWGPTQTDAKPSQAAQEAQEGGSGADNRETPVPPVSGRPERPTGRRPRKDA